MGGAGGGVGWGWGVSNVCMMSKKGIKIKEGNHGRNQPLLYHRGKEQIKATEMKINKLC